MERKVTIKNLTNGRVHYTIPNRNVRRMLLPWAAIQIPFAEIEEGLYDYGIKVLFAEGILTIEKDQDAVDLGLKVGQGIVEAPPVESGVLSEKLKGSNVELMRFLKNASATTRENIGAMAVEMRVVDPGKVKIIEEYTGVNVLTALKRADDIAEPVKNIE